MLSLTLVVASKSLRIATLATAAMHEQATFLSSPRLQFQAANCEALNWSCACVSPTKVCIISRRPCIRLCGTHAVWDFRNCTGRKDPELVIPSSDWAFTSPGFAVPRLMDESEVVITSLGPVPSIIDAAVQVMESNTRKVCEHFVVMRVKSGVDAQQEAEMLDVLWSLQFHFDTILSLSIGKLVKEKEGWTHALHIRFESKGAWDAYLNHPILKETEKHCQHWLQDVMSFGFEADVDDVADSIHQKGERFENGSLEHVLCMEVRADTSSEQVREMEEAVDGMPGELGPSIIVQFTRGPIFNASNCHFTYALMARLTSGDALKQYVDHPYHQKISSSKVRSICSTMLSFDYVVDARAHKRKGIYGAQ